jgi:hypothetical protein
MPVGVAHVSLTATVNIYLLTFHCLVNKPNYALYVFELLWVGGCLSLDLSQLPALIYMFSNKYSNYMERRFPFEQSTLIRNGPMPCVLN